MKKKRILIGLGVVAVVVAGVVIVSNNQRTCGASGGAGQGADRACDRGHLSSTIDSSGSVSPESKVTLSFGTSGTVNKVNVQPGDAREERRLCWLNWIRAIWSCKWRSKQQAYLDPASGVQYDDCNLIRMRSPRRRRP